MNKNERNNHDELNGTAMPRAFRMRSFEGASILLYTHVPSVFQFKESVNSYGKKQVVVII
jgi:hypothetical protein